MKHILNAHVVLLAKAVLPVLVISGIMACMKDEAYAESHVLERNVKDQAPSPYPDKSTGCVDHTIPRGNYEISGVVFDIPGEFTNEVIDAIVTEAVSGKLGKGFPAPPMPAQGVVVSLRGESVSLETTSGPEGNFNFSFLPLGDYEVSAEKSVRWSGEDRKATAKRRIEYWTHENRHVFLQLRADLVAVKGRITDGKGRPIAGAKVSAIEVPTDDGSDAVYPDTQLTVSNADGSYEIQGLQPTSPFPLTGYLTGEEDAHVLQKYDIRVECDTFVQSADSIPRVPQVTEEGLNIARRLLAACAPFDKERKAREKEGVPLPVIKGNTITGIDIVLTQVGEK